jgi:hypothetical protein
MPCDSGIFVLHSDYEKAVAERDVLRVALTSGAPMQQFALVVDRNYDGEGISLAIWNGENYSFTDGDCYDREGDTLDGYEAEWLTDYQVQELINAARAMEKV